MSYSYETEKHTLFTEENSVKFLKVRDFCKHMLKSAGAVRADKAMNAWGSGSAWTMLAALDRLVEIGELREVTHGAMGQHRVFVDAKEGAE